jgi:uncharacterized coiled-coil protein SlyX
LSRFEEFAKRYHAVKEGVQELAEQDLEKANTAYTFEISALQETMRCLADAKRKRLIMTQSVADLAAWGTYIARLETRMKSQQTTITALGVTVAEKRSNVKTAYIDQKKWLQIVNQHVKKKVHDEMYSMQQQADEGAVIRHGRGI